MEALYFTLFGIACFVVGATISRQYTKDRIRQTFKDYFEKHKSIGFPKFKDLI